MTMLDQFLQVAYEHETKNNDSVKLAKLLKGLPMEDLKKIASGEAKLSFGSCDEWIEKYKGTPLFEQALALEKADLEAEVARTQAQAAAPPWDTMNKTQDQIRVQKKMLDLELLELENGQARGTQQPMDVVPDAQGAAAPGNAGPAEMLEKAASVKEALSTGKITSAIVNTIEKGKLTPARMAKAEALGKRVADKGGKMVGKFGPGGQIAGGSAKGLPLIRQGEHLAREMKLLKDASATSADFAKVALELGALKGLGSKAVEWAAKNPTRAGALAGAGLGAVGGAVAGGPDHRLSGALGGAALGGGLGHAAGGIGSGLARGKSFSDSAKRYGKGMKRSLGIKAEKGGPALPKPGKNNVQQMAAVSPAQSAPISLPSSALQEVPPSLPAKPPMAPGKSGFNVSSKEQLMGDLAAVPPPAREPSPLSRLDAAHSMARPSTSALDRLDAAHSMAMAPTMARPPVEAAPPTLRSPLAKAAAAMRFSLATLELNP